MAMPNFESLMLPILKIADDGQEHRVRDVREILADQFELSSQERVQLLPSGADRLFNNRVGWAVSFIKHARLVEAPRRGYFRITDRGKQLLSSGVKELTSKSLMQYPEFAAWGSAPTDDKASDNPPGSDLVDKLPITPQEQIENGYTTLRHELEMELLARVKACSPDFFEEVVVRLLVAMGYGGSISEAGRRIGRSHDGGVDGVIKEDRLGLDQIYVQAKRWDNATVGRPDVQGFVGALAGLKARRGVFITTSTFAKPAREYAESIDAKVVLIDGPKLAEYMVDYGIGVTRVREYEIKAVDNDFFEADEESTEPPQASGQSA